MKKVKWLLLILLFLSLVNSGCSLFKKLDYPAQEYIKADRQFYTVLTTPRVNFVGLIEGSGLTDLEKKAVLTALANWEFMIQIAEEATGLVSLPNTE